MFALKSVNFTIRFEDTCRKYPILVLCGDPKMQSEEQDSIKPYTGRPRFEHPSHGFAKISEI